MKDHHKEIPLDVHIRIVNYASELQLDQPESIWMDTVKKTKALDGFTLYDG
jgi:N-glycosylase/DNA lyase